MTPEEYEGRSISDRSPVEPSVVLDPMALRALAERCAKAATGDGLFPSERAALREASAAIPALLDAREEDRADIESLTDESALRTERDQTHARMGALVLRAEEAEAREAALRAQLADAIQGLMPDGMVERTIEGIHAYLAPHPTLGLDTDESGCTACRLIATAALAAALSVPAVPEEKP